MANLPQTLYHVDQLYRKLRREGLLEAGAFDRHSWVQVRVRGEVFCAQVLRARKPQEQREQSFVVESSIGQFIVGRSAMRACGAHADRACACSKGAGCAPARTLRPCVMPPLGNTGVTS